MYFLPCALSFLPFLFFPSIHLFFHHVLLALFPPTIFPSLFFCSWIFLLRFPFLLWVFLNYLSIFLVYSPDGYLYFVFIFSARSDFHTCLDLIVNVSTLLTFFLHSIFYVAWSNRLPCRLRDKLTFIGFRAALLRGCGLYPQGLWKYVRRPCVPAPSTWPASTLLS